MYLLSFLMRNTFRLKKSVTSLPVFLWSAVYEPSFILNMKPVQCIGYLFCWFPLVKKERRLKKKKKKKAVIFRLHFSSLWKHFFLIFLCIQNCHLQIFRRNAVQSTKVKFRCQSWNFIDCIRFQFLILFLNKLKKNPKKHSLPPRNY